MSRMYRGNIPRLYLIKLSKWFMLIMPIVALFYDDNGLSTSDIYLLQAAYSLSVAILEIPSGYMADIIGRKKSLLIGSCLGTLGFVIYSFSESLESFLVAEIILGFGGSFISGSDSALLYDSLAADNKEHQYLQYEGRITSLGSYAETLAAVGGGLIAFYIGYRGVYIAQACIASIAIPAAMTLVEPTRKRPSLRPSLLQLWEISYQSLVVQKKLRSTILLSSIIGTATLCMAWTSQIYFIHNGFTEKEITPLWVVLNLCAAVASGYAFQLRKKTGSTYAVILIALLIPLGYIALGSLPLILALPCLVFFYLVRGFATPFLKDLTNKNCSSATRATVLSIRNMIIRFGFATIGQCIGFVAAKQSLSLALNAVGLLFLVLASLGAVIVIHNRSYE